MSLVTELLNLSNELKIVASRIPSKHLTTILARSVDEMNNHIFNSLQRNILYELDELILKSCIRLCGLAMVYLKIILSRDTSLLGNMSPVYSVYFTKMMGYITLGSDVLGKGLIGEPVPELVNQMGRDGLTRVELQPLSKELSVVSETEFYKVQLFSNSVKNLSNKIETPITLMVGAITETEWLLFGYSKELVDLINPSTNKEQAITILLYYAVFSVNVALSLAKRQRYKANSLPPLTNTNISELGTFHNSHYKKLSVFF